LEVINKCETDLPGDILVKVSEYEKSDKLNPPREERVKQILTKDLAEETSRTQKEGEQKGIAFPSSLQRDIKTLPLYEDKDAGA